MSIGLISIIMPAYNGERFIRQAMDSVVSQTYSDWELIVIDDGSEDGTAEIVSEYHDSRIQYVYQQNQGQAAALNYGLELAKGEFITTLDVDDWYTPESLYDRVKFLENHPEYGAVIGDGFHCDVEGKPLMRFSENRAKFEMGDVYDVLIANPIFSTGGNVVVRKSAFDTYHIRYDKEIFWCQDWDVYIRLAEHIKFGFIDTICLWYRMHEENMTMRDSSRDKRIKSLLKTKMKILSSSRYTQVPTENKVAFFYGVLLGFLSERPADQKEIIETIQFNELTQKDRARLLRLVAVDNILHRSEFDSSKEWLKQSRSLDPFDSKTNLLWLLIHVHPSIAFRVVSYWRRDQIIAYRNKNLLLIAKESN